MHPDELRGHLERQANALQDIEYANRQSNAMLDGILSIATNTNSALADISHSLERLCEIGELQHRERYFKEIVYQFERFYKQFDDCGDRTAMAYGVRRFFDLITGPEIEFSTADLSDLADKRHFDSLLDRGRSIIASLSAREMRSLEQFEILYGAYHCRIAQIPDVTEAFPLQQLEPQDMDDMVNVKMPALYVVGIVVAAYSVVGICVWAVIPNHEALAVLISIVASIVITYRIVSYRNRIAKMKEEVFQQEQRKIERKVVKHNAKQKELRKAAKDAYVQSNREMKTTINAFLDQHRDLQQFVSRV